MRGHGAYWLLPAAALLAFTLSVAFLTPIPIHYKAEALEEFYAFIQQSHPPEAFDRAFCDRGMCVEIVEGEEIAYAFSHFPPEGAVAYLAERNISCTESGPLYRCLSREPYPLPEGYERVEFLVEKGFTLSVDFEGELGNYTLERLERDFGPVEWAQLGRAEVVERDGRVLQVLYPAGEVGSEESGLSFLLPIGEWRHCRLSYYVYFPLDFEFSRGGKLPGLSSNGSRWSGCKGKPPPGAGWSARVMWREDKAHLYLYWPLQEGSCGDYVPPVGESSVSFERGQWHNVVVEVNGETVRVEVDGSLVGEQEATFGSPITHLFFTTFFGGSDSSWAPSRDVYAYFDNITLVCNGAVE